MKENILLINKPKGITSFDVIRKLRRQLGIKKMGHAGTLDPLASGLMIIAINEGTKKLDQFLKLPKVYIADILLGESRDTGDMEGEIIEEKNFEGELTREEILQVLEGMKGKHKILVPKYSAIKVDGKPLYKYAREGIEPPRIPEKEMEILDINLLEQEKLENRFLIQVEINVSSGSYIRSISEEIGKRFGYPSVLADLKRISIGEYKLEDASDIEDMVQ